MISSGTEPELHLSVAVYGMCLLSLLKVLICGHHHLSSILITIKKSFLFCDGKKNEEKGELIVGI